MMMGMVTDDDGMVTDDDGFGSLMMMGMGH